MRPREEQRLEQARRIADWALDPLTEERLLNTNHAALVVTRRITSSDCSNFLRSGKNARRGLQARRAFLFMSCVVSKRISMPRFIKPQLATLKSKAPKGEHWL